MAYGVFQFDSLALCCAFDVLQCLSNLRVPHAVLSQGPDDGLCVRQCPSSRLRDGLTTGGRDVLRRLPQDGHRVALQLPEYI